MSPKAVAANHIYCVPPLCSQTRLNSTEEEETELGSEEPAGALLPG